MKTKIEIILAGLIVGIFNIMRMSIYGLVLCFSYYQTYKNYPCRSFYTLKQMIVAYPLAVLVCFFMFYYISIIWFSTNASIWIAGVLTFFFILMDVYSHRPKKPQRLDSKLFGAAMKLK